MNIDRVFLFVPNQNYKLYSKPLKILSIENNNVDNNVDNRLNYFYNPLNVSFKALVVQNAALSKSMFFDKFKSSNISLIQFLKKTSLSPEATFKLLCKATSDKDISNKIVRELSLDPRKSNTIKKILITKLGGDKKGDSLFRTWFHDEKYGYRKAYQDYYENEIWNKSKSLAQIVKHSPLVAPWALKSKAEELKIEPTLGEIPKEFGDINSFRKLVKSLEIWNREFREKLEIETEKIRANNIGNTMEYSSKINELVLSSTKPFEVDVSNNRFHITPIVKSFSAKLIFLVDLFDKNKIDIDKSYILKFPPYSLASKSYDESVKFVENQALRPDMPYLDSLVDFYLKENKSPNAPDIKFFDYNTQAVLYKKSIGEEPVISEKYADNLHLFVKNSKVSDIAKLGIELNDVHSGNFLIDEKGNYILIDSGHVKFANTFRPPVVGMHIIYGNLCGRELCK
jgi:hypothetical protein